MPKHRTAVDLPAEKVVEALNCLPFGIVGKGSGQTFYPAKSFKRSPCWAKALRALPRLLKLADLSSDQGIKHVSMRSGVSDWDKQHELGLSEDSVDDLAYSLRAIINQSLNMKQKNRKIPKMRSARLSAFSTSCKRSRASSRTTS